MCAMSDALTQVLGKRKAKTRKGKRILEAREPKIVEEAKTAMIIRGNKSSIDCGNLLRDLHRIRTPLSMLYVRKHDVHPFEDISKLEHLCKKFDHSLFAFGSSSKKRPFRLILGRFFDNKLLDMQEFGVDDYKSLLSFGDTDHKGDSLAGAKPLVIFQGSAFETDERVKRSKSLLLDFFSGPTPDQVLLEGLEHVIVCSTFDGSGAGSAKPGGVLVEETPDFSAATPKISVARYRVVMLKSGSKLPRIELKEVGPRFRLTLDRAKDPERDRWKAAIKVPKAAKPKKTKNVKTDATTSKRGKIHLGKQDFNQIHTVHHSKAKKRQLDAELSSRKKGKTAVGTEG